MKRLILTAPTGLTLDQLTPEQQSAIQSVFGQFTLPMPGTISYGDSTYTITTPDPQSTVEAPLPDVLEVFTSLSILDAVTADNFNPDVLVPLGLPFGILGMWQWDGVGDVLTELQPLDASFINYLPDAHTYDDEGNVLTTTAPTLLIPHGWCGWPQVVL